MISHGRRHTAQKSRYFGTGLSEPEDVVNEQQYVLSFVVPEIILGVSLYILFTSLFKNLIQLGTNAQLLGLISFQLSYPVIIVRARLLSIGPEYEEAAMDLGATPGQSIRRVLLPLLAPAIMASIALVFADTVDDFVTVQALSGPASSETLAIKIYSAARASPTPEINAAATMMLIAGNSTRAVASTRRSARPRTYFKSRHP